MTRLFAVLAVLALAGVAFAPTAAAGVPEPICWVLCIVVVMLVTCAAAEGTQQATGQGAGCAMMDLDPFRDAVECFVQDLGSQAGLAPPCPPA